MTAPQRILPTLYTALWRASSEVYHPTLRSARAAAAMRAYHPTRRRRQEQVPQQRYGTANEPPPHLEQGKGGGETGAGTGTEAKKEVQTKLPKIGEKLQRSGEEEAKTESHEDKKESQPEGRSEDTASLSTSDSKRDPTTVEGKLPSQMVDPMLDSTESLPTDAPPGAPATPTSQPLAEYLHQTPTPKELQDTQGEDDAHAEEHPDKTFDEHSPPIKAPHIDQPRYIHHFDTYGLVRKLMTESAAAAEGNGKADGFKQDQAITVMKAVRLMLADNTDLAKEALVSKSQLENEAYLFKAACAELKTEVVARRKSEQEKMRTERTQLQHEVDILTQRLGQESAGLKDELKGMFDDRKMAVRNEQRDMERQISQLNYKITVELQADAKSEIEGLRLVMTRRVILTLGIIVLMVIGGLKIMADATREAEETSKKRGNSKGAPPSMVSSGSQTMEEGPLYDESGRRVLSPGEVVVGRDALNPGFVSLG